MALLRGKVELIPSDAVILSESEAFNYQMKILHNWKNLSDIWPFKYGSAILSSLSALTGIYLNGYYRRKLKLFSYGRMATYLPICMIPAMTTYITHTEFVLPRVVLQNDCPVCTEISSSSFQAFGGCIFPSILAPLSTFSMASKYVTYDIPYITKEPRKVFQLYKNLTMPISNTLLLIFVGQALTAAFITYMERSSVEKCNEKLMKLEYEVDKLIQ